MPKVTHPSHNGTVNRLVPVSTTGREEKPEAPATPALVNLQEEPDVLGAVQKVLPAVGVVGEQANGLLTYLAFTSRLLSSPLCIITRGKTGTGKSTLLEKVAELFPADAKVNFQTFTDASLFNGGEDCLRHKILITGERKHSTDDAGKDANRMIRQLLSEKRISRSVSVPGRGEGGRWVTELQVREGPVSYGESCTAASIFEEDLDRLLELFMDESPKQNRSVKHAIGSRYDAAAPDPEELEKVLGAFRDFQGGLAPYKVVIPYWEPLADGIPDSDSRCRRVAQQVFSVIESVCLLHQYHRRTDGKGRLLATVDDYAQARKLLLVPVHAALGLRDTYRYYEQLLRGFGLMDFDSNAALRYFASKPTRDAVLGKLIAAGLAEVVRAGGSHKATVWKLLPAFGLQDAVLPRPEALQGKEST
jgi:hypothetical protein